MRVTNYELFYNPRFEALEYFDYTNMVVASKEALEWVKGRWNNV